MPATTYDINVRYHLDDKASKNVGMIGREARRSAQGIGILARGMRMLQTAAIGFFGFRTAKKYLIDYNSELDQARIQMGGLLQMNMGGRWSQNQKRANMLIRQFRDDAKASTATTKDFVDFASLVTGPLSRAGASMDQIRQITKGGVIAAKAFGIEGEVAARDIEQALAGTLSKKDRFARALLEPMGLTTTKWNEMVKKSPQKAADALTRAFNQPAIKQMAKAQENSWAGVVSTFQDHMQRFFGKVGMPLMKALTKEIQGWNKWLEKNEDTVQRWATSFGKAIVDAFKFAKRTIGFIIEHRDLLLTIAKAYLAVKAGGIVAGAVMGVGGMVGDMGLFGANLKGTNGKLKMFASRLGVATAGLGLLYVGAKAFANWVDKRQEKQLEETTAGVRDNAMMRDILLGIRKPGMFGGTMLQDIEAGKVTPQQKANARFMAAELKRMKIGLDVASNTDRQRFAKMMGLDLLDMKEVTIAMKRVAAITELGERERTLYLQEHAAELLAKSAAQDFKNRMKANASLERVLGSYLFSEGQMDFISRGMSWMGLGAFEGGGRRKPVTNVNVTVKKIEVVGDDPDRLAMGLVGAFQELATAPVQTRRMHPGVREGR